MPLVHGRIALFVWLDTAPEAKEFSAAASAVAFVVLLALAHTSSPVILRDHSRSQRDCDALSQLSRGNPVNPSRAEELNKCARCCSQPRRLSLSAQLLSAGPLSLSTRLRRS